ncbi:cytochrome c biogenesis protein ResB [Chitinimonas koreensis]|uniref:cytochrome c biogenesis protein ResB n=1 Tax=Chitinimonas koreensis TaxID=356302 RepID=UPI001B7F9776|nr:cytochrome c biogenesis protein ResB [Chitinimonas koreensis]
MRRTSFARALFELLSSMRFAISLLTVIAIASVIGTVLQQNQPYPNYAIEFGDFWFVPFEWLGLFDVYHAGWFLGILAFLVLSTSLCIYRHLPGVLRDVRHYREHAALKSLRAMAHQAEFDAADPAAAIPAARQWLAAQGYRFRQAERDDGTLLAAKKGSLQRLGYLFAHAAIVIICIGGLLDGNLPFKLQEMIGSKRVEMRNVPQSQVPAESRLGVGNLSFRGILDLPEGGAGDVAFVNAGRGYFVQELPFQLRLKKFHIEHYSTGQPKLFASDIEVIDKASGKIRTATVKVNHPLIVDGIAIYQSSFGDGGSKLEFALWDWAGRSAAPQPLRAVSQNNLPLSWRGQPLTLEFGEFRAFNIENLGATAEAEGLGKLMQDARQVKAVKKVKNVGPSIQFKVRDGQGQAREYLNYLSPVENDGRYYLMSGVRSQVADPFAFVRIPLDGDFRIDGFMRLRAVLFDPAAWPDIARRTAERAEREGAISGPFRQEFEQSLQWVLQRFSEGGFAALERFLDAKVPQDKRQAVAQTYIKLLQGAVIDAQALAQERAGLPVAELDEARYRFLMDGLVAVSASFDYGSGFYLQPTGFEEVKSSGFQLTRSPGKNLVYFGSLLLVLGIFCMFYIRENRIWVFAGQGRLLLALSSNRRDDQTEREFAAHRAALAAIAGPQSQGETP